MGQIVLARVDSHLEQDADMLKMARANNANILFVSDIEISENEALQEELNPKEKKFGFKRRFLNPNDVIRYWNERKYDDYRVILLVKEIDTIVKIVEAGVPITHVNIANLMDATTFIKVTREVGLNQDMLKQLAMLNDVHSINVYFQKHLSSERVELADVNEEVN